MALLTYRNLSVEVDDSTQCATVRGPHGVPMGTLHRRRRFEPAPNWMIFDMDGRLVGSGPMPSGRLADLYRWLEKITTAYRWLEKITTLEVSK